MKIETIKINGKPHIVGIGNHVSGYGHFIAYPFGRNVRADVLIGGYWTNVFKTVAANVSRVEIDTDELLPYIDYFAPQPANAEPGTAKPKIGPDGIELKISAVDPFENESKGPRFDHYYASPAAGSSGENLNATALALHILLHFGVWVLNAAGDIVQPVTFKAEFAERSAPADPYQVTVIPVDYAGDIADLQYSISGQPNTWQASPVLIYPTSENQKIYVKDIAGTIGTRNIGPADWNHNILP